MKLIIQIPCLNEREYLGDTFADLPRQIPGIDTIEVLVVDDGSTDGTSELAEQLGVHHIVRFPRNRGLAAAYTAGMAACVRLGADIIVNTDADNQYCGEDIERLVEPIVAERANIVIGDRQTDTIRHFSRCKRVLQRLGSGVLRRASGVEVRDATSGFRALSREAATTLFVHDRFSYTLETIIQAGEAGLAIENVPIRTNLQARDSRLFKSIPDYLRHSVPAILRAYSMYWPVRTFGFLAISLVLIGVVLVGRFLYFYIQYPDYSGHVQSLLAGVGAVILGFVVGLMAMLGDLMASNRRLIEEVLTRVRTMDAARASLPKAELSQTADGIYSTGAASWWIREDGNREQVPSA